MNRPKIIFSSTPTIAIPDIHLKYYYQIIDGNGKITFVLSVKGMLEILIRNNIYLRIQTIQDGLALRATATDVTKGEFIYNAVFQKSYLEQHLNPKSALYKTHKRQLLFNWAIRYAYYSISKLKKLN